MTEIVSILAIIFLVFWSAFFSSSEIALFSLPATTIKGYQNSKNPRKRLVYSLLDKPRDLLVTVFMLNTLINILLQNVSSAMFGETSSWLLKVGFPLVIVLLFGEILPKYAAMQRNVVVAMWVAPLINFFTIALRPIREWTVRVTTPLSRLMFFFLKKDKPISNEEIIHILETSKTGGALNTDEATLIHGFMTLRDSAVVELMRTREEVLFYDIHDPLSKLIHLFVDEQCTRLPVCDHHLDNVLGIITATDFFLHRKEVQKPEELLPFLRKPLYLPESTPARMVLRRFHEKNEKLALIVDEYRAITGLISQEDLVEEVVGEITDRRDQEPLYERQNADVVIASGKLELEELQSLFGIKLESPNNMLTIGGWLTEQIGDIPKPGFKYETGDFLFHVLAAEPNRIKKVYIRRKGRRLPGGRL